MEELERKESSNSSKEDIERTENLNLSKEKKDTFNWDKVNSKIESIKENERLSFNKEEFSGMGTLNKDNSIGESLYMNKNWEKVDLSIDINNETINIWDQTIHVNMPKWASLKEVEFWENEVEITWKLWFFSWSWTAEYPQVISSIDNTLEKWESKIASKSWDITLKAA